MTTNLLFAMPGGWEWIFILFAILLLFGGRKIPELMKGLGKGMKEFKKAKEGGDETATSEESPKVEKGEQT